MSGYTFTSKMETLEYLFSGMEERMLESQESTGDNELHVSQLFCSQAMVYASVDYTAMCFADFFMQGPCTWLPCGWLIEVRAGGKKMDKMYKVGWRFCSTLTSALFQSLLTFFMFISCGSLAQLHIVEINI